MQKNFQQAPELFSARARAIVCATLSRFLRDESGATAIEYGLIAALIGVTALSTLKSPCVKPTPGLAPLPH